ncbi:MAG: murein biosynthesis integral membrane protein MurJ, partial [bacterium (Candidatus Ratteibacteria) CG15_BIG_FIL_POST_REV_8_21_14_020_41_12]
MESHKNIAKAAGIIALATIFCRIAGLGREVITANFFGTALVYDAFLIAFMIPNFLRGLFAEGALSTAFIPVFTGYVTTEKKEETEKIASIAFTLSLLATLSLVILVILGIFISSRFFHFSAKVVLILNLLKVTLPYLILISLAAVVMGILNSYQHFVTPAFAPIMLDLCWIGAIFFLCPLFGESLEKRIFGLATGVLIGGLGQFLIQLPALKRRNLRIRFNFNFRHPAIRRMVILLAPSVIGVAVTPINILVDSFLAIKLGPGMVSSLWYANRLMQLPLGIFGVAMATATLPTLSGYFAKSEIGKLKGTLSFAIRNTLFIIIPSS